MGNAWTFVVGLAEWAVFALAAFWLLEHYTDWRRRP